MARIPRRPRRIAEELIAGDVVADPHGNRGTVIAEIGDELYIDWGDESGMTSGSGISQLTLIERPSHQPGETEPGPSLPSPRSIPWRRVDVGSDDLTLWVHYDKAPEERLQRVDVIETETEVAIAIFISDVGTVDPRWQPTLRYGRPDSVGECTRVSLEAPLGDRTCLEVVFSNR